MCEVGVVRPGSSLRSSVVFYLIGLLESTSVYADVCTRPIQNAQIFYQGRGVLYSE